MRKIFYLTIVVLLLVGQIFAIHGEASSKINFNNDSDDDLFLMGGDVIVNGDVDKSCYIFSGDAVVNGRVNEDLYVFCGDFTLNGTVEEDLNAFCGNIVVSGDVHKDINAYGGIIVIDSSAVCYGDLNAKGGKVYIDGTISGDVEIEAEFVTINGIISGDAEIKTGNLDINDMATISGNLEHNDEDWKTDSITIRGHSDFKKFHTDNDYDFLKYLKFFFVSLIFGIIWFYIFPTSFKKTGSTLKNKPGQVLAWGLLYLLAGPIVALISMILIITIPFSFIYYVIYGLFIFMGQFVLANFLGNLLAEKFPQFNKWLLPFISGLAIVHILIHIPFVRGIVWLIWIFLGTATLYYNIFNNRKREKKQIENVPTEKLK
ncbi:MAG: polymer-forming cytoskeletal protein [Candidatus Marinimicrobia bacterium]|nr:polymer-forming cytoskeletal protein [Candidatus Neomarinimicrobiota bacterium]